MKKFAKVFFGIIWVLIGLFCFFGIPAAMEQGSKYNLIVALCLNVIWWTSSVYVYKLSRSFNKRKSYWNPKQKAVYEDYASSKESAFWYKIPKGIKIAAASIWLFIDIMFLLVIISYCGRPQPSISSTGIFLSAGWLIITIAVLAVIENTEKKTDKRLLELYDEKYISNLELCDEFLGTMLFKYDSYLGRLESVNLNLPPFGTEAPSYLSIFKYNAENIDNIFVEIKAVYEHADEILNGASEYACHASKEYYKEYYGLEALDEVPTSETIRENAAVTSICKTDNYIELFIYSDNGEENDFSPFEISALIDFQKKTIDYDLEN